MTQYEISDGGSGVTIELTGTCGSQDELLVAFGECQTGQCSCPTEEYQKVDAMDVEASTDAITIRLHAKPDTELDTDAIAACLDYTVTQAEQ